MSNKNNNVANAGLPVAVNPEDLNHDLPLQDRNSISKLYNVITSGKRYSEVLRFVENEIKESTRLAKFEYKIECFLSDGAYALSRAVTAKIGFSRQQDEKNISGSEPPTMVTVYFADGSNIKVPFGKIDLPSYGAEAQIDMKYNKETNIFSIVGQCENRYVSEMDDIVKETKQYLATDSIYKGKAIRYEKSKEPTFIDLRNIDQTKLYLTDEARFNTQPVEARIEKTEECIAHNIDIKFGILLEGNYGTGKTLYAFKLAKKAMENGWTFIYCKTSEDTLDVMKIAQRYCKCGKGVVLFIEDIDQVLNKRDDYTNEISLMMDGGESKNINLITIFTTNHIENIEPTFLRGKRIGSIVTLTHPDFPTALEMLMDNLTDEFGNSCVEGSLDKSAQKIVDYQIVPAFIAEIVDMVKSHLIFSNKKVVTDHDVSIAIDSYQRQINIAKVKSVPISLEEQLGQNFSNLIERQTKSKDSTLSEDVTYIKEKIMTMD